MDSDELMIKVENVSKVYKLGEIGGTTLRDEIQRLKAKIFHKEDPTKKIGSKDYNKGEKFKALDNISFEVKKGERIGIIGHNGAGKSTLLKLISRVTGPTNGKIFLNGRVASMLEVGTGFHPELTGRENIYMNGAILGMTKTEIDAKIEDIIEFSEVRQFIDTPVKRYSSGMYVKLAFSVAAHLDSEIMIMDEVLAVGDMAFQNKCLQKMKYVSEHDNRTLLYVSHNMNTIKQLCDRIVVLNHGQIVFDGDVDEGINIYMGGTSEFRSDIRFTDDMRSTLSFEVCLERLVSTAKDCIYAFGSSIDLNLYLKNRTNEEKKCYIRIIAHHSNGEPVCMCCSKTPIVLKEKEQKIQKIAVDFSQMVPGNYYFDLVLFELGSLGVQKRFDSIQHAFVFRIIPSNNFNLNMPWTKTGWGFISSDLFLKSNDD